MELGGQRALLFGTNPSKYRHYLNFVSMSVEHHDWRVLHPIDTSYMHVNFISIGIFRRLSQQRS